MTQVMLRPGDVVHVGPEASVQFSGDRGLTFRIIRVDPRVTYDGWIWLDGYVLDAAGNALQRRRIFVQRDGLRPAMINRGAGRAGGQPAKPVNRVPQARSGSRTADRPGGA